MRVLWVDADENPWIDSSGWSVLEDFGVEVRRASSVGDAQPALSLKDFDVLLVRAELPGAPGLLVAANKTLKGDPRRIVMASSDWSKEQFKIHSKTEGAAHRYARIPMPAEGFLGLLADVLSCSVEELADFHFPQEKVPESPVESAPKRKRKAASSTSEEEGDADVLRKYLRIKEEQLEISEGERQELVLENERLQKEALQLQMSLREMQHLQEEISKKLLQMEEEKEIFAKEREAEADEKHRLERNLGEKIRGMEGKLSEAAEKYENLRLRVRKDIRKIRENERDLEARLELLRKDSETILQSRDQKVLEMQRKIDALEFDLDQVQDGKAQAQIEAERYLAKLSRVSRALQIAVGLIEESHGAEEDLEELEPVQGGAASAEEVAFPAPESGNPANTPMVNEEAPPADPSNNEEMNAEADAALSAELDALAHSGEATQMISAEMLDKVEGDSSSG